jgi:hypothetical protein
VSPRSSALTAIRLHHPPQNARQTPVVDFTQAGPKAASTPARAAHADRPPPTAAGHRGIQRRRDGPRSALRRSLGAYQYMPVRSSRTQRGLAHEELCLRCSPISGTHDPKSRINTDDPRALSTCEERFIKAVLSADVCGSGHSGVPETVQVDWLLKGR